MKDQLNRVSKIEDIQQITIHLPCLLAERAKKHAKENGTKLPEAKT